MSRADSGQLERSLTALSIGVQSSIKKRRLALSESSGEFDQQVRLTLSGHATSTWGHVDKSIGFRLPFLAALAQRDPSYSDPHFTYGIVFDSPSPKLVMIVPSVVAWKTSGRGWIVGALVRCATHCPLADSGETVAFNASAHLNFQGYAAYPETAQEI